MKVRAFFAHGLLLILLLAYFGYSLPLVLAYGSSPGSPGDAPDPSLLRKHLEALASVESRFTGYPGFYKAVDYVVRTLRSYGLNVTEYTYPALIPLDEGSYVELADGRRIPAYTLYPNLVATGAGMVRARLVYGGLGSLEELRGKVVKGAIVVLNACCGYNWINALRLGASGIIFVGSFGNRLEAMAKLLSIPLSIPRVYVPPPYDAVVVKAALAGEGATLACRMRWRIAEGVNVVAIIPGSERPDLAILLLAYLDSWSITPALAPGADQASGVAVLLELARLLALSKPKYTVVLVVTSGHWQGLAGARHLFRELYFGGKLVPKYKPYVAISLDLSTGSSRVYLVGAGFFYFLAHPGFFEDRYMNLPRTLAQIVKEFSKQDPETYSAISSRELEHMAGFSHIEWFSYVSLPLPLDGEVPQLAGTPLIGVITNHDARLAWFTPEERRADLDCLVTQAKFIWFLVRKLACEVDLEGAVGLSWSELEPSRKFAKTLGGGWGASDLVIEVVEYDPRVGTLYRPVPGAIVHAYKILGPWVSTGFASEALLFVSTELMYPFGHILEPAGENGTALIPMVASYEAQIGDYFVEAYKVDEQGRVIYAPDEGIRGSAIFPHRVEVRDPVSKARTVVFRCGSVVFTDIWNPRVPYAGISLDLYGQPRALLPFTGHENPLAVSISVYEHGTHGILHHYGYRYDHWSGVLVVFTPPGRRFEAVIKFTGTEVPGLVLVNGSMENPDGVGYGVAKEGDVAIVPCCFMRSFEQLLAIAKRRAEELSTHGIKMPHAEHYLSEALDYWRRARAALEARDYARAYGLAIMGWPDAVEAYIITKSTFMDVVMSTAIVSLMLVPFVLILLAFVPGKGLILRLTSLAVLAIITFTILRALHPGFVIIESLPALLTGVIVLTISLPALIIFIREALRSLGEIRRRAVGAHFLRRELADLAVVSVIVGVETMKKRPLRTALSLILMIVIAAALTSLTSMTPVFAAKPVMTQVAELPYEGLLIHAPGYIPLNVYLVDALEAALNATPDRVILASWVYSLSSELPIVGLHGGKEFNLVAIMGVSPAAAKYLFKGALLEGRWFGEGTLLECVIPQSLAEQIGIRLGDHLIILGYRFKVVGILNDTAASQLTDIDLMPLSPVNRFELAEIQHYDPHVRLPWESVVIVPERLLLLLKVAPVTCGIALEGVEAKRVPELARGLFEALHGYLFIFGSYDGLRIEYRAASMYTTFGFKYMLVPSVMAILVMMLTLTASAYERRRELSIYGVLGLPPKHIALTFFAECLTYAILGVLPGYLIGLIVARVLLHMGVLPATVSLNVTSSSTMSTLGLSILLVVLAAIYPLLSVARMITPSLERRWRITTKPKGDEWEIPLPFHVVSREEAAGVALYIAEYLSAYRIERGGTFTVIGLEQIFDRSKDVYGVKATVWLPPYELDIKQDAVLEIYYSKTEGKYLTVLRLRRLSGTYDKWVTSNYAFVDAVRKQLLTWRLLAPAEKRKYYHQARQLLKKAAGGGA